MSADGRPARDTSHPRHEWHAASETSADAALRAAMNSAMDRAAARGKCAEDVAAEMRRLLGAHSDGPHCSVHMLRNYLGQSSHKKGYRLPAAWLPALCRATGDNHPLHVLASQCGFEVVSQEVLALAEIGRGVVHQREIAKQRRRQIKKLEGLSGGKR